MNGRSMKYLLLIFLGSLFSCIKPEDCHVEYDFKIDFELSPAQAQFKVGDTILIASEIQDPMQDLQSGMPVNLGTTFKFPLIFIIGKSDSVMTSSALEAFEFQYHTGNFSIFDTGIAQSIDTEYAINEQTRELRFSFIAHELGVYFIELAYVSPIYGEDFLSLDDNCRERARLTIQTNGNQTNYNLIDGTDYAMIVDSVMFRNVGGYAFEVIE